jgi:hypothetical protein
MTMPKTVALSAISPGMWKTKTTMSNALINARIAAKCAWTLPAAMRPRSTTIGIAATIVDSTALPSGLYV